MEQFVLNRDGWKMNERTNKQKNGSNLVSCDYLLKQMFYVKPNPVNPANFTDVLYNIYSINFYLFHFFLSLLIPFRNNFFVNKRPQHKLSNTRLDRSRVNTSITGQILQFVPCLLHLTRWQNFIRASLI